ncbi:MAG: STAS domain-containing protein [Verrucomicrobiota bacterium]
MSNGLSGYYEVAVGERAVYLRVHGLGSMTNCFCLRDVLDELIGSKRGFIVFDLADCSGMDSTFMGVIAGVATQEVEDRPVAVAVVNASRHLVKLLVSIGLTELLFIDPDPFSPPNIEFHVIEEQATDEDRLQLIREAHEHLIAISGANEKLFGSLLRTIEDEMRQRGIV